MRHKEYVLDVFFTENTGTIITNKGEIYIDRLGLKKIMEGSGDIKGRDITYDEETCCISIWGPHKVKWYERC